MIGCVNPKFALPGPGLTVEDTVAKYRSELVTLHQACDAIATVPYSQVKGIIVNAETMYGGRHNMPCLLAKLIGVRLRQRADYHTFVARRGD